MKAVLDYLPGPRVQAILSEVFGKYVDVVCVPDSDPDRLMREAADCDVLLHVLKPVTAAFMATAGKLALVQKLGVGVDTIDLKAATLRGIAVCNMPGTNTQAVAELTLSLMLAAVKRLKQLDRETTAGRGWDRGNDLFDGIGEICGAKIGLLGYGAVPKRLAPVLRVLGADVAIYSRTKHDDGTTFVDLDEILQTSDVISLHLPLTPETVGILDAARVARMKKGAILVNTARGGLVEEAALLSALQSGHLSGAALDVFPEEPVEPSNALLSMPNVIVTPHVAWLTLETWRRSFAVALENCMRIGRGESPLHQVN